jgi:hypothetical protein
LPVTCVIIIHLSARNLFPGYFLSRTYKFMRQDTTNHAGVYPAQDKHKKWIILGVIYICVLAYTVTLQTIPPVLNLIMSNMNLSYTEGGLRYLGDSAKHWRSGGPGHSRPDERCHRLVPRKLLADGFFCYPGHRHDDCLRRKLQANPEAIFAG